MMGWSQAGPQPEKTIFAGCFRVAEHQDRVAAHSLPALNNILHYLIATALPARGKPVTQTDDGILAQ